MYPSKCKEDCAGLVGGGKKVDEVGETLLCVA